MKTKVVVTGLIEDEKKNFLISLRNDPTVPEAHLKWDFLGGVIDFGETPEQALVREVQEEAGIEIKVLRMIPFCFSKVWSSGKYGKIHAIVFCYHCKLITGQAKSGDAKVKELRWIKLEEFGRYNFLPSIEKFLTAYQNATKHL